MGYGGGFYGRYLADKENLRLRSIGIGFRCQQVEQVPVEVTDVLSLIHIYRNGCRRCVSVCYIMSAEEDPARRTQRTGNSGRLLLCLRSAGIRSGKTVVPPCGSSGNSDFGTDHYVVTVLVPCAIVALSAGTGFSIYSRRQADALALIHI